MSVAPDMTRLARLKELIAGSRLESLEPREVLLQAARLEKLENDFRAQYAGTWVERRVAVLASQSVQHFVQVLRLYLYSRGIAPSFYVGPYGGVASEALDANSGVYAFQPDVLLVLPDAGDIIVFPALFDGDGAVDRWAEAQASSYRRLWNEIARRSPGCIVLHALFVIPFARQLGNLESSYGFSRTSALRRLNDHLRECRASNVTLLDMDFLASYVGKEKWFDEAAFFLSKQPFSLHSAKMVASLVSRIIGAAASNVKKCLAVDLDNTLWGGVIGDDGLGGINVDPNHALGEAYLAFQRYLKGLRERGVLLAACSKNDESSAKLPFLDHQDMVLRLDDFAAFVANWDDKVTSLHNIAQQLNIGLDAIVFFDDNPAERELVRTFEPRVEVIDVPDDPALFIRALESSFCFEWLQLTPEDISRADSYAEDRKRLELQAGALDYDSFLRSLEMEAWIEATDDASLPRVGQLVNKTNQFNLRTQRYSEGMLKNLSGQSEEYSLLHIKLKDKFTNYGIISSILIKYAGATAFVENWVLSCRVFKRTVEEAAINSVHEMAKARGCAAIVGEYIPTSKNGYVAKLYQGLGFVAVDCTTAPGLVNDKGTIYQVSVADFVPRRHYLRVHLVAGNAQELSGAAGM